MITFLMIARVLYDKGFQQYVEAAQEIIKKYPDTQFLLLGDLDIQYPNHVPLSEIKKYVNRGIIKYLGYRSDVVEIIKDADCIIHPSYYNEGMSRVLMEALAMKKPIITTDIPGCRDMVEDGYNGFLCKPRDTYSLQEKINQFLTLPSDTRKLFGERGREIAEKRFDIKYVIQVYHHITDMKFCQNNCP